MRAGVAGLSIGSAATCARTFTRGEVQEYIALTRDPDPRLRIDLPVVPNVLLAGLFSQLLGMRLPGPGTNYLKQSLRFPGAAHIGDEIVASVEVIRLRPEKELVNLRTLCEASGRTVCEGEALVLVRDVGSAP